MKLPSSSYEWALDHLRLQGDTDLFPTPFEIEVLGTHREDVVASLSTLDIPSYRWKAARRFMIPTGHFGFRAATQLDPIDSVLLTAIIHNFGSQMEHARVPRQEERVFSYRFDPHPDGRLYGSSTGWSEWWTASYLRASQPGCSHVVIADVADCYNQMYHHTLEQELAHAGIDKAIINALTHLLGSLTSKVSRGIPVGPHASHLLAEVALSPIDHSLLLQDIDYCRYVDDFHIFCGSRQDAEATIYKLADTLDKQQRLVLQRQKTSIMDKDEFLALAERAVDDDPACIEEREILSVLKAHTGNDQYAVVNVSSLKDEEVMSLKQERIEPLLCQYLDATPQANYPRLRWVLRRLSQVGAPGGVELIVTRLDDFMPVIGDACRYLVRAAAQYDGDPRALGKRILTTLRSPLVQSSAYLRTVLVGLFSRVAALDNIQSLIALYDSHDNSVKRKVVLAAAAASEGRFWIKERKDEFRSMDPWLRRAFTFSARRLPGDEGEIWIKGIRPDLTALELVIAKTVSPGVNLGSLTFA